MKIRVSLGFLIFGYILAANANSTDTSEIDSETTTPVKTTLTVTTGLPTTTGNETTISVKTTPPVTTLSPTPTAPLPTPAPREDPKTGQWVLRTQDNYTCLRLDAAIQLQVKYEQTNEQVVEAYLNVPTHGTLDTEQSSCEHNVLTLAFNGSLFSLEFYEDHEKKVFVKKANFTYNVSEDIFPGAKDLDTIISDVADNLTLFKASKGKSYLCKEESKIKFNINVTAVFTNIQAEAFKNSTKDDFSQAEECSRDKISDIVPIAVGCALAALVIIVLIAYLVGRQRARQRGYQSV